MTGQRSFKTVKSLTLFSSGASIPFFFLESHINTAAIELLTVRKEGGSLKGILIYLSFFFHGSKFCYISVTLGSQEKRLNFVLTGK